MLEIAEIVLPAGRTLAPERLFDCRGKIRILVDTEKQVDFRDLFEQVLRVTLGEAAGDYQQPASSGLFILRHIQDRVDGFLLGGVDEPAGINQQDIRLLRILCQFETLCFQKAQGGLGVHPVLVAAEGNGAHRICHEIVLPPVCLSAGYRREYSMFRAV